MMAPSTRPRRERPSAAAATLVTLGLLAACGADPEGFNESDVAYASDLTEHHAQTLKVLDLSIGRPGVGSELGALADRTRSRTFDEVEVTQRFLQQRDQPVPRTSLEHDHSEDHSSDASIPGVLGAGELRRLERADDQEFREAWLRGLVTLEEGAVELASTAVEDAQNAELAEFAENDLARHRERLALLRSQLDEAS